MTVHILPLPDATPPLPDAGLGVLTCERGNLPLESVDIHASVTGLAAGVVFTQGFQNPHDVAVEATYIFPMPDRAAVTGMRMEAADRVVEGKLEERGKAREEYDAAIAAGQRAAIAEEDRPDVFTMRVGNILPGERVTIRLTLSQPLPFEDGAALLRFPLVVAPRYIPGAPLGDLPAGDGVQPDTDAVPDASRISPPVLLPGFPNPVRLSLIVDLDTAGLDLAEVRCSLHAVVAEHGETAGRTTLKLQPGERLDRDFVLRLGFAGQDAAPTTSLTLVPDEDPDAKDEDRPGRGVFALTVLPPEGAVVPRPRDVVVVLDRSGSMGGWKIVAARRAAARIIDTLTTADRFAVLCFDHVIERPRDLGTGLNEATDRNRFRAVEHLAKLEARGGTEMAEPLREAAELLRDPARDRVLVLVTDGQVGNEDQILTTLAPLLSGVRLHTVGIDRAVNAGFLNRLAALGQGRMELVESEDRLDQVMDQIHHRIAAPLVTGLTLTAEGGLEIEPSTIAPARHAALFPGVPLTISGRWTSATTSGTLCLTGTAADGTPWSQTVSPTVASDRAAAAIWARAHLRDLEDRYVTGPTAHLEKHIVVTSLRFGVLCRFTAFVAVDTRVVTDGGEPHRIVQPVEQPSGWAPPAPPQPGGVVLASATSMAAPRLAPSPGPVAQSMPSMPQAPPAMAPAPMPMPPAFADDDIDIPDFLRADSPPRERSTRPEPALQAARQSLKKELAVLRDQASESDDKRWTILGALRRLLVDLTADLARQGVPPESFADLTALISELPTAADTTAPQTGQADLTTLWDRTVRTLTTFTQGQDQDQGDKPGPRPQQRRAFWKRS